MTTALTQLEDALAAELRATQTIAALTERERAVLQEDDLAALADLVREKETLLAELSDLEAIRDRAATEWALEQNLSAGPMTFDEIMPHMDSAIGGSLGALRDGIHAYLDYARSLVPGNKALLQAALDRNAALRNFLVDAAARNTNYSFSGMRRASDEAQHFVEWSG